jgi:uncharacterized protein YjiK
MTRLPGGSTTVGWRRNATACALLAALVSGCSDSQAVEPSLKALHLEATHPLQISEPSDLAIDETGKTLWTVTNKPARVYQLDLEGNVVKTLKYEGEDLEGIAYDPASRTLWVAEERSREVVHLSLDGDVIARKGLDLAGKRNHGPEGICLDDRGRMFLVNEKDPGMLVELGKDLAITARRPLEFAGDYSGISYDRARGCFWIVSDESRKLYLWSRPKGVIGEFPLAFPKAEGVAVDEAAKRVYVVSDSENTLYVFRM